MKRVIWLAALFLGGCGYFNTMYNADRAFAEAERARERGTRTEAETAYKSSIDKATKAVLKRPNSRWAGRARMIIARSHFALGNQEAASIQFNEIAQQETHPGRRAAAQTYLGQIAASAGSDSTALQLLDAAISSGQLESDMAALAYLTRARVHASAGRADDAFRDLERVRSMGGSASRAEANLLRVRVASVRGDTSAVRAAINDLLQDRAAELSGDSLRAALRFAQNKLGTPAIRALLSDAGSSTWNSLARDSVLYLRAVFAVELGDTTAAIAELSRLAQSSTGPSADHARVRAAEWMLARARTLQDLSSVRASLLPALGDERARALVQSIKTLEVLLETANRNGQPLFLFAAAELARDDVGANHLASHLFTTYADLAPQTVWAGKALLAALDLEDGARADSIKARLSGYRDNPYVAAMYGGTNDADYEGAEDRLSRSIQSARAQAMIEAVQRDNTVTRAVTVMDSIRLVARNDSTRVSCGILIDSLSVAGIRADSVRAACLRRDRARITAIMRTDTLVLRDSTRARADSAAVRRRPPVRDTISSR